MEVLSLSFRMKKPGKWKPNCLKYLKVRRTIMPISFWLGMCKEKVRSPFSVSGPLSQVFCLGVISQWMGEKLVFDRDTKQIVNNPLANQLLWGAVPRDGWADYYKI